MLKQERSFGTSRWRLILFGLFGAISLVTVAAYLPSLAHPPRSDHWMFILESMHLQSISDLFRFCYSVTRVRTLWAGDSVLFRPGTTMIWGVEKLAFGSWLPGYQLVGIFLHLAVIFMMVQLMELRKTLGVSRSRSAAVLWVLASFFVASNFAVQEQVIWTHIHGYLVFNLLVLIALASAFGAQQRIEASPGWLDPVRSLWRVWAVTGVSLFFCEIGQAVSLLLAGYLSLVLWTRFRRWVPVVWCWSGFLAGIAAYQILNFLDLRGRNLVQGKEGFSRIFSEALSFSTLANFVRFIKYTLIQPFFPFYSRFELRGRLRVVEQGWAELFLSGPFALFSVLAFASWGLITLYCLLRFRRGGLARLGPVTLIFLVFVSYAMTYVLGRLNIRTYSNELEANSYYAYLPLVLLAAGCGRLWFAGLREGAFEKPGLVMRGAIRALPVCLLLLGARSSLSVFANNLGFARMHAPTVQAIQKIRDLIDSRKGEEDFSIAFDTTQTARLPVYLGISVGSIFFAEYEDNIRPKYVVTMRGDEVELQRASDFLEKHPERKAQGQEPHLFPQHLVVRNNFNIFRVGPTFFGVSHAEGVFDPLNGLFTEVVTARDAEIALAQSLRKFHDDTQSTDGDDEMLHSRIQGRWISRCQSLGTGAYGRLSLEVSGKKAGVEVLLSGDPSCRRIRKVERLEGRTSAIADRLFPQSGDSVAGSGKLNMVVERIGTRFEDSSILPPDGFCGITHWESGRSYDLTGTSCGLQSGKREDVYTVKFATGRISIQAERGGGGVLWNLAPSR